MIASEIDLNEDKERLLKQWFWKTFYGTEESPTTSKVHIGIGEIWEYLEYNNIEDKKANNSPEPYDPNVNRIASDAAEALFEAFEKKWGSEAAEKLTASHPFYKKIYER